MLPVDFLTVNEQIRTVERHLIMYIARLNKPIYFKNVLTSKFRWKDMPLLKSGSVFISIRNERVYIPSDLKKIRFDQGILHKIPDSKHKAINKK